MRSLIAALLLTTTATPALAAVAPDDREERRGAAAERVREARAERAEQREQREQRQERRAEQREERRERTAERVRSVRNDAAGENGLLTEPRRSADQRQQVREQRQERRADRVRAADVTRPVTADSVAGWRARERQRRDRPVISTDRSPVTARSLPTARTQRVARDGIGGQVADRLQRSGVAAALASPEFAQRWRENWRRDNRHDWRRHRDQNRSLFRFGYYHDPFGYSYRRFGLGYQLYPSYYGSRYWLNDPWQYRLPYVGGSYRWVRYWDDALLVDLRTGRVVDVLYDFFW